MEPNKRAATDSVATQRPGQTSRSFVQLPVPKRRTARAKRNLARSCSRLAHKVGVKQWCGLMQPQP